MKLLAILIAFGLFHWLGKPKVLQSFFWWQAILNFGDHQTWLKPKWLKTLLLLILPVVLMAIIAQIIKQQHDHQLWYLLFNSAVLYYCLGPEQLEVDAEQILAGQPEVDNNMQRLINKLTDESIQRWFVVVFWFVLLGAAGAFLCRLLVLITQYQETQNDSLMRRLYDVLAYPVIWLMIISLLVASDFDRIWHHCKRFLKPQNWYLKQRSLLYEAMDFAVENCEIEDYKSDDPVSVRETTLAVLKRMLMVWLVLVAFSVIFTIG